MLKRGSPGCPCCHEVCRLDQAAAETPPIDADQTVIRPTEHPQAPYPTWVQVEVRAEAGAVARVFVAWNPADGGDGLYVEFAPEDVPDLGTLKIFRRDGTQIGDTLHIGCAEPDRWHRITICYDPDSERITACVDVGDLSGTAYHRQCTYATVPEDFAAGRQAGYGTGSGTVQFRKYRFDRLWYLTQEPCAGVTTVQHGGPAIEGAEPTWTATLPTSADLWAMLAASEISAAIGVYAGGYGFEISTLTHPTLAEAVAALNAYFAGAGVPITLATEEIGPDETILTVTGTTGMYDLPADLVGPITWFVQGMEDTMSLEITFSPGELPQAARNEIQRLTAPSNTAVMALSFGGQTTWPLSPQSTAAQIQAALESLSNIGIGNVTVTGSNPWTIEFTGSLGLTNQPQLIVQQENCCNENGGYYYYGGGCERKRCHDCSPGCLLSASDFDRGESCLSQDLAAQFDVPATGVTHDTTAGTVIVTEADRRLITIARHPDSPYAGQLRLRARIAAGSIARIFLAASDADNLIAVEIEPDTDPPTPCHGDFGWIRFYRFQDGTPTLIGHQFLRRHIAPDEWLQVYVWCDPDRQRVSIQVDRPEAGQTGEIVTEWFATWPGGDKAGFGTGQASAQVEFDDFAWFRLGRENGLECGESPHSCLIVPDAEMFFDDQSMPCAWQGPGGDHWAEYSGTHRTVFAHENVKVRAVFAFGALAGAGDSTTVGVTGAGGAITATLTELPPEDRRLFELVWRLNGDVVHTVTNLGINETGGISILICPTIIALAEAIEILGQILGDPIGVTITQPTNGETKLTHFEVANHPRGLPTLAECAGCGTCREHCNPAFELEWLCVDLGAPFLSRRYEWSPVFCSEAQGVLELDVAAPDFCKFEFGQFYVTNPELPIYQQSNLWMQLEVEFYPFPPYGYRWQLRISLSLYDYSSGQTHSAQALYRIENLEDCTVPDEGYWTLQFTTEPGFPPAPDIDLLNCFGTWPDEIRVAFNPGSFP